MNRNFPQRTIGKSVEETSSEKLGVWARENEIFSKPEDAVIRKQIMNDLDKILQDLTMKTYPGSDMNDFVGTKLFATGSFLLDVYSSDSDLDL